MRAMRSREQRQRASSGCVSNTLTPSSWNSRNKRRRGDNSGIDQLARGGRAHQHHGAAPAVLDIVGDDLVAALGRHPLQHQTAGPPGAVFARARHRQLDAGLDLLGLPEIMLGAFGQVRPGQLDDALIALGVLALVDREGDIAGADQRGHRRAAPAAEPSPAPRRAARGRIAHSRAPRPRSRRRRRSAAPARRSWSASVKTPSYFSAPASTTAKVIASPSTAATGSG